LATTAFVNAEIANDAPTKTGGGASGTWGINVTGNAATATSLSTDRTNWSTNGTIDDVVGQLAWKNYGNNHTIFDASQSTAPNGSGVNNTNAQIAWTGTYPTLMGWNGVNTYGVRVDSARVADVLANSSGSAPSYACRAWVNFNGTGTVAIRASGNVSSITDNGAGDYTVNFATAMPDANYAVSGSAQISSFVGTGWQGYSVSISSTAPTASAVRILTSSSTAAAFDASIVNVTVFR
jgi:hypothetical protein